MANSYYRWLYDPFDGRVAVSNDENTFHSDLRRSLDIPHFDWWGGFLFPSGQFEIDYSPTDGTYDEEQDRWIPPKLSPGQRAYIVAKIEDYRRGQSILSAGGVTVKILSLDEAHSYGHAEGHDAWAYDVTNKILYIQMDSHHFSPPLASVCNLLQDSPSLYGDIVNGREGESFVYRNNYEGPVPQELNNTLQSFLTGNLQRWANVVDADNDDPYSGGYDHGRPWFYSPAHDTLYISNQPGDHRGILHTINFYDQGLRWQDDQDHPAGRIYGDGTVESYPTYGDDGQFMPRAHELLRSRGYNVE